HDGDGVYETSTVFADGFNHPLDGTAAGLLAMEDDVWLTMIPSLIRLEDANRDGWAETQERMFDGFGVRIALRGHDMHGLAIGLDGRLYWSIGDRGYHVELEDGQVFHSPGEGAVFRCEFDGSDFEIFHHGLRNPQELAFDNYGNLFTGDNNSDAGDKARLVYCVEGGETGWRMEYQTLEGENKRGPWVQENGWDPHASERPAWILPAIDTIASGPSGLTYYPGGGLDERYEDHFFLCDFRGGASYSRVLSFAVESKGAGFKKVDEHVFIDHVLCVDVDFSYDGKVVVSDWGFGWVGNEEGRLYSVWDEEHRQQGDVSKIFSEGFTSRPTSELIELLGHNDRRVRIRAQLELSKRDAADEVATALQSENQLKRIHAMWTLAMLNRKSGVSIEPIAELLHDEDDEVRVQGIRILGESGATFAYDDIATMTTDANPRVAYFATIASGHLGDPIEEVVSLLESNNNEDVYLRHAGVVALANSQYASAIANLKTHPSPAVRLGAVLALRKQSSPLLAHFLTDQVDSVATEAARAIHDVPVSGALHALAKSLPDARTYPWQRRAMSASERLGNDAYAKQLVAFALEPSNEERMRLLALSMLATWTAPPNREQVEGKWWPAKHFGHRSIESINASLDELIDASQGDALLKVFEIAQQYDLPLPEDVSKQLLSDETQPMHLRVFCLTSLGTDDAIRYGLTHDRWELRAATRFAKLNRGDSDALNALLAAIEQDVWQAQQAAIKALKGNEQALASIDQGSITNATMLDYAESTNTVEALGNPLDGEWLLVGGDVQRGRTLVYEHTNAQCMRCHKIGNYGGIAGPALDGVGSRLSPVALLESIIDPNAVVAKGYGEYSSMPPMTSKLSHQELRDIVAYLKTLQ
ncbi:MAG: c-type cytochrome, partial [Phycisphaerales bacterium]|nr:c-type cytochrome [Phycisphaerales bacterium]